MNNLVVNVESIEEKDGTHYFPRTFQNVMNVASHTLLVDKWMWSVPPPLLYSLCMLYYMYK